MEAHTGLAEQLALLVDATADYAIFMLDPEGRVATWNTGARRIKGYRADEIIGQHFSRFYTEEDIARDHPANELQIARREGRYEEEGWRLRKDGTRFWASVVITALRDADGDLVGFGKVTRDLTARREAEQELRASADELARSNAELERFASSAAHDLTQPLATIAGLADLVASRYAEGMDEEGRTYLDLIRGGAANLRGMVDGLLNYARAAQQVVRPRPIALGSVMEEVTGSLRAQVAERGATIVYDTGALPVVEADADLLAVVLRNLVSNGLKFNERPAPRVEVTAEPEGEGWRVVVTDDGLGVPEGEHEQIFAMFHRLHSQDRFPGTGLGLALTRRIVERHGGQIGVESTPGGGSRFWFTLPAPGDAASPAGAQGPARS